MAVLEREEFFRRVEEIVGENTSDEAIAFVEDVTDTYNDLEERASQDTEDWEQRYRELDEKWRKKYTHRFYSGAGASARGNGDDDKPDEPDTKEIRIEDLFVDKE